VKNTLIKSVDLSHLSFVVHTEHFLQEPYFSRLNIGWMCWYVGTGSAMCLWHSSLVLSPTLRFTLAWNCVTASGPKDTLDPHKVIMTRHISAFRWPNWMAAEASCGRTVCKLGGDNCTTGATAAVPTIELGQWSVVSDALGSLFVRL